MILAIKQLKTSAMAILSVAERVGVPSNTLLSRNNSSPDPGWGVRALRMFVHTWYKRNGSPKYSIIV